MEVLKVKELGLEAIQKKLDKAAFDEVELNPHIREKNKELYGEDLTANQIVERIVNEVRYNGDEAVIKYTKLLDGADFTPSQFLVTQEEYAQAYEVADEDIVNSLRKAIENVRRYHQEQKPNSWITYRNHGSILGQSVIPLDRVGVYVPGGTAAYPSSVVMNVMPAKVAGVKEIIMMAPPSRDGKLNPYVLIAAKEAGVDAIYKVGGAQAIAAMAFGTETIPKVDKITGPGNIFVATAKKQVYGIVGIDMIAGPSEIGVIADSSANPTYVAADLLSQAEHDTRARAILVTDSEALADAVESEIERQLKLLPREAIARPSVENNGRIIIANDTDAMFELMNLVAPEHLEIAMDNAYDYLEKVENAGSVFLGHFTSEPIGDYYAGANHVLPTTATSRFSSALGVHDFVKRIQYTQYDKAAVNKAQHDITTLAYAEGLQAHAKAIEVRNDNN